MLGSKAETVADSLNAFIASHRKVSSNVPNPYVDQNSAGDSATVMSNRSDVAAKPPTVRARSYLRADRMVQNRSEMEMNELDGSKQMRQSLSVQNIRPQSPGGGQFKAAEFHRKLIEKRSTSNNSRSGTDENKQVRFDIKEGLMAFIEENHIQIDAISEEKKARKENRNFQRMEIIEEVVAPPKPEFIVVSDKIQTPHQSTTGRVTPLTQNSRFTPRDVQQKPPRDTANSRKVVGAKKMASRYKRDADAHRTKQTMSTKIASSTISTNINSENTAPPPMNRARLPQPSEPPTLSEEHTERIQNHGAENQPLHPLREFSEEPAILTNQQTPQPSDNGHGRIRPTPGCIVRRGRSRDTSLQPVEQQYSQETKSLNPTELENQENRQNNLAGQIVHINRSKSRSRERQFTMRGPTMDVNNIDQVPAIGPLSERIQLQRYAEDQTVSFCQKTEIKHEAMILQPAGPTIESSLETSFVCQELLNKSAAFNQRKQPSFETSNYENGQHSRYSSVQQPIFCEEFVHVPYTQLIKYTKDQFNQHMECVEPYISQTKELLSELVDESKTEQQNVDPVRQKQVMSFLRTKLPLLIIGSFADRISELISLRQKFRDRLKCYRQSDALLSVQNNQKKIGLKRGILPLNSTNQEDNLYLKVCLLSDICSRLRQKIVMKGLYLAAQIRIETQAIFLAYFDLLIVKAQQRRYLSGLRENVTQQRIKREYVADAIDSMERLRKLQIFDCWRRLGPLRGLDEAKLEATQLFLQNRKAVRILGMWRLDTLQKRRAKLGTAIADRYRMMKLRHQLFAHWSDFNKNDAKIRQKAIDLLKRRKQQVKGRRFNPDDSSSHQDSLTSLPEVSEAAFDRRMNRSEELFNAETQDLVLEREHLQTVMNQLQSSLNIEVIEQRKGLSIYEFNKVTGHYQRECVLSQALIANREGLYKMYPEYAPNFGNIQPSECNQMLHLRSSVGHTLTTVNKEATLLPINASVFSIEEFNSIGSIPLSPYKKTSGLTDALQPNMLSNLSSAAEPENNEIEMKYQVHAALVLQQNMFGKLPTGNALPERSVKSDASPYIPDSNYNSLVPFALPSKKTETNVKRGPNMLFDRLQNQNRVHSEQREVQMHSAYDTPATETSVKVPLADQIQIHMRQVLTKLRTFDHNAAFHRQRSLAALVVPEFSQNSDYASITDYTQAALQSGVSLVDLNAMTRQSEHLTLWRKMFLEKLLVNDITTLHNHRIKLAIVHAWRKHQHLQQAKADRHFASRQLYKMRYGLLQRWANAQSRLDYERENKVRRFKLNRVMYGWKRLFKMAVQPRISNDQAIQWCETKLKTKALICMYLAYLKNRSVTRFLRKTAFVKFFKRRWMPIAQRQTALRNIIQKLLEREAMLGLNYGQRKDEMILKYINIWRKRSTERHSLIQKLRALEHYKHGLLARYFEGFRRVFKVRAGIQVLQHLVDRTQSQPAFDQILQVHEQQEHQLHMWRRYRGQYITQKIVNVWHSLCVSSHLSRMFFKRRYLHALYLYTARKKALNQRQTLTVDQTRHQAKKRLAFSAFKQYAKSFGTKKLETTKKTFQLAQITRLKRKAFVAILENVLVQKRRRIVATTVKEFREATIMAKYFRFIKIFLYQARRQNHLNAVADQFYREKRVSLDSQMHMFELQSDVVKQRVVQAWKSICSNTNTNTQSNTLDSAEGLNTTKQSLVEWRELYDRADSLIMYKKHLMLIRCFLAWRSLARREFIMSSGDDEQPFAATPAPTNPYKDFDSASKHKRRHRTQNTKEMVNISIEKKKMKNSGSRASSRPSSKPYVMDSDRDPVFAKILQGVSVEDSLVHSTSEEGSLACSSHYQGAELTRLDTNTYTLGKGKGKQQQILQSQPAPVQVSPPQHTLSHQTSQSLELTSQEHAQSYIQTSFESDDGAPPKYNMQTSDLYTELDSIFRLNKNQEVWNQEQQDREKFLNEMQAQYGTIGLSSEYASLDLKNNLNHFHTGNFNTVSGQKKPERPISQIDDKGLGDDELNPLESQLVQQ